MAADTAPLHLVGLVESDLDAPPLQVREAPAMSAAVLQLDGSCRQGMPIVAGEAVVAPAEAPQTLVEAGLEYGAQPLSDGKALPVPVSPLRPAAAEECRFPQPLAQVAEVVKAFASLLQMAGSCHKVQPCEIGVAEVVSSVHPKPAASAETGSLAVRIAEDEAETVYASRPVAQPPKVHFGPAAGEELATAGETPSIA